MTDLHQKTSASRLIASSPFFSSLSRSFYLLSSRSCFVAPLPLPRDPSSLDPSRLLSYRPKSLRKLATRIESSRVEGTGERKSERVEEEKGSGGEWRRGEGERRERGENPSSFRMEFRADGTLRFYQRIQQPNDGLSFLILRSFFYFFFFSSFLFPLAPKPSPIYDAPRALVDISPDRLKNHYRETISWEGEEREVNIWTDLIAGRLKARGASHPFIELVCRVKPQKAIKSIGDPFPLFLARLETTKDSRDQNPRCSTLFSSLARMRERSMEIVECAPRQFISLCISKCNKQHGGGPLPYAHVRYPG